MASRFYFDSTTAPARSPTPDAAWEHQEQFVRRRLNKTKQSSAMTTKTTTVDSADHIANQDNLFYQFVSNDALSQQTIAALQTLKLQIRAQEDANGNNLFVTVKVYLIDSTGTPVAGGEILAITRDDTEVSGSALVNRQFTATAPVLAVTCPIGSYLVVEVGLGGLPIDLTGTQDHDGSLRVGDDAVSDLAESNSGQNEDNPWFEIPNTLSFMVSGTLAKTLNDVTVASSGTVTAPPISGTLSKTLNDVTLASSGDVLIKATLAKTLDDVTLDSDGEVPIVASLNKILDDVTLSVTGDVFIVASLAKTLDDTTVFAEGAVAQTSTDGSLDQTLNDVTLAASGMVPIVATLSQTLDDVRVFGTNIEHIKIDGNVDLESLIESDVDLETVIVGKLIITTVFDCEVEFHTSEN